MSPFKYLVIMLTSVMAMAVTMAWFFGMDISLLMPMPVILHGEYWRLLTSLFIQIDILHALFNLYWLLLLGAGLERVYGHVKTAGLLGLFAVGTATMEYTFDMGGAGLTGVVYGLLGFMWVVSRRDTRFQWTVNATVIALFAAWLAFCNWQARWNAFAISDVSCMSGLVLGLLAGGAVSWPDRRRLFSGAIAAILLFGLWGSTFGRSLFNGYEQAELGYQALAANRNEESVAWFEKALAHLPKEAWAWSDLSIAYRRIGNMPAAEKAAEQVRKLGPDSTQVPQ